jgi:glycosyltransferase involved in cell wall biosynthesis
MNGKGPLEYWSPSVRLTFILPDVKFTTRSGGYRVHYETANRLAQEGHDVTIVHKTKSWKVWLRGKLWPMLRRRSSEGFIPWFTLAPEVNLRIVMQVSPRTAPRTDVFLFTAWGTTVDWPRLHEIAPAVVLVWDYEFWIEGDGSLRQAMRAALAQPDLGLVAGSLAVEQMLITMGLTALATIPPGLDFGVFTQSTDIEARARNVGFLNRPEARRGVPDAIEALATIHRAHDDVDVVAGGSSPDALPDWVHGRSTASDAELAAFYNDLMIFVLPSHAEGLGLPALEAMACGAAVVVTDNGGSAQFARDGFNALVVPPRDSSAITRAIERLLSDDSLRRRIAENGRDTAATFTWEQATRSLQEVLTRVASEATTARGEALPACEASSSLFGDDGQG